jgi:hypothetical protein
MNFAKEFWAKLKKKLLFYCTKNVWVMELHDQKIK